MRLRHNIVQLFVWQGGNYIVPLIVTPYLARTLGLHAYGVFGLTLAVMSYCMLVTDWGFGLSATQKIAFAANDPVKLRTIFWNTMAAKMLLGTGTMAVLAVTIVLIPQLRAIWPALSAASLAILATALSSDWFLQGMQRMGSFAVASLCGRLMTIPLMLIFVHRPEDVAIAAVIQGLSQALSAMASIVISSRLVPLWPMDTRIRAAFLEIRDGSHQFISNLSVSMYTQANAIFVGVGAGAAQAGLLTSSQRISQAFQGLVVPINLAVYPMVNRLMVEDRPAAIRLMIRVLIGQALFAFGLSAAMYLAAPAIVPLFLGNEFEGAIVVVRILALLPFLIGVTNVLGTNMLLPLGLKRHYTGCLIIVGVFNIIALCILAPRYGALGGAACAALTEAILVCLMASVLWRRRKTILSQGNEDQ